MNTILLHRLINEEGFKPMPYKDSEGFWTIGYGWCFEKRPITEAQAEALLEMQITEVEKDVLKLYAIWYVRLSQIRQSVILDLCFQMGVTGFSGFHDTIAKIIVGDFDGAATAMLDSDWARKETPNRASALADLFRKG